MFPDPCSTPVCAIFYYVCPKTTRLGSTEEALCWWMRSWRWTTSPHLLWASLTCLPDGYVWLSQRPASVSFQTFRSSLRLSTRSSTLCVGLIVSRHGMTALSDCGLSQKASFSRYSTASPHCCTAAVADSAALTTHPEFGTSAIYDK